MRSDFEDGRLRVRRYRSGDTEAVYEAVREGVARNRVFRDGRVRDAVVFSLIPEDVGLAGE